MTPEDLERAIQAFDADAVVQLLLNASEKERRAAAPIAIRIARAVFVGEPSSAGHDLESLRSGEAWRRDAAAAASAAVVGTCSLVELCRLFKASRTIFWRTHYWRDDWTYRLLEHRRPAWLADWVEWTIDRLLDVEQVSCVQEWLTVRSLIRSGVVERPETTAYLQAVLRGVAGNAQYRLFERKIYQHHYEKNPRLLADEIVSCLRDDPGLLEHEIWRVFKLDDPPWYEGEAWRIALSDLVVANTIDREQLYRACAAAIPRGNAHSLFCIELAELLGPSLEERAQIADELLLGLDARVESVCRLAIRWLGVLNKSAQIEPLRIAEAIAPAFAVKSKTIADSTLKLLGAAAQRDPAIRERAAMAATEALRHPDSGVQRAAVTLLKDLAAGQISDCLPALREAVEYAAESVKPLLRDLLPDAPADDAEADDPGLPLLLDRAARLPSEIADRYGIPELTRAISVGDYRWSGLQLPFHQVRRLHDSARITPITHLDELIDVMAAVIEQDGPAEEMERALDGVSRLCAERPPDFERRTSALLKRASPELERTPENIGTARWEISRLAQSWIAGAVPYIITVVKPRSAASTLLPFPDYQTDIRKNSGISALQQFLSNRVYEVAVRAAARRAAPLLSAPTHAGGWLDPAEAVTRFAECMPITSNWELPWSRGKNRDNSGERNMDVIQALLRIAPDGREEALRLAVGERGENFNALRYALGAVDMQLGRSAPIWIPASRARSPFTADPGVKSRFSGLDLDAGEPGSISIAWNETAAGREYQRNNRGVARAEPPPGERPYPEYPTVAHYWMLDDDFWLQYLSVEQLQWIVSIWPQYRYPLWRSTAFHIACRHENPAYASVLALLTDPQEPVTEEAADLLVIALGAKLPLIRASALDALIAAIADGRLTAGELGPALDRAGRIEGAVLSRWAAPLGEAARVSILHACVIYSAIERFFALRPEQKHAALVPLLEFQIELMALTGIAISNSETIAWLGSIRGTGKAAGLAKLLLAGPALSNPNTPVVAAAQALSARIDRAEQTVTLSGY